MKASFRGIYDTDDSAAAGSFVVNGGDVKLQASMTGDTFVNGPSLNGLILSVEKPGSFVIDYNVPKKDVKFQFMNTIRVNEKPLNLTYTHLYGDDRTAIDGTLMLDSSNKASANYGIDSGNLKMKYSYVHRGMLTFEPCYDFGNHSWDLAVSKRVYDDSVVRASYHSSTRVLGVDLTRKSFTNGSFKVSASVNLAEERKLPKLSAESIWDIHM